MEPRKETKNDFFLRTTPGHSLIKYHNVKGKRIHLKKFQRKLKIIYYREMRSTVASNFLYMSEYHFCLSMFKMLVKIYHIASYKNSSKFNKVEISLYLT